MGDEIAKLEAKVEALHRQIRKTNNELVEERERNGELRGHVQALEERVTELEGRTELLGRVERGAALGADEKAAVLIRTLVAEAGQNGTATMDATAAVKALGGEVDRTTMYGETGVFKRAEQLVGDTSVLRYVRESRRATKNSRLVLDRTAGTVPRTKNGFALREEAVSDV